MIYGIQNLLISANIFVGKLQIGYFKKVKRVGEDKTQVVTHRSCFIELYNERHEIEHTNVCDNSKPNLTKNLSSSDSSNDGKKLSTCNENFSDNFSNHGSRMNNSMDRHCECQPRENVNNRDRSRFDDYEYSAVNINCGYFSKWARYNLSIMRRWNIKKTIKIGFGAF
uniref:PH domain-containing protein n=1 Tax=Strongyloides papillosus TaxID=174720 RepID=A0A0N5CAN7_STREA